MKEVRQAGGKEMKEEGKRMNYEQLVRYKSKYIRGLLKKNGKYTPELAAMVSIAASALAHLTLIGREFSKPDYSPLLVETSREGSARYTKNPVDELSLRYLAEARACMDSLGISVESKGWSGNDGGSDFLAGYDREE